MRITTKGQVTIPQNLREECGFLPHTEVRFKKMGNKVVIEKTSSRRSQIREWIEKARGSATSGYTTDEIMRMTRGED
ncbi:MAG: AbrB/MazE/SpoVT family DNA-binding domain-containing protein [Verrucomicrobiia bacterium]